MSKRFRKTETYQVFHYLGETSEQELANFVGDKGKVTMYVTERADIFLTDTGWILRVNVGDLVVKGNQGSWGAYPKEEFTTLFIEDDKPVYYMLAKWDGTWDKGFELDPHTLTTNFNRLDKRLTDAGYYFILQDDGGFEYEHPHLPEKEAPCMKIMHVYSQDWRD